MSETVNLDLSGVAETLLVTLYLRAIESQRPDALIKDEKAVALVKKISVGCQTPSALAVQAGG